MEPSRRPGECLVRTRFYRRWDSEFGWSCDPGCLVDGLVCNLISPVLFRGRRLMTASPSTPKNYWNPVTDSIDLLVHPFHQTGQTRNNYLFSEAPKKKRKRQSLHSQPTEQLKLHPSRSHRTAHNLTHHVRTGWEAQLKNRLASSPHNCQRP